MIMAVVMMMIMIVPVAVQEFRLDFQDAIEIERVAPQHLVDRDTVSAACDAAAHKD